jgi:hypothetical protein
MRLIIVGVAMLPPTALIPGPDLQQLVRYPANADGDTHGA